MMDFNQELKEDLKDPKFRRTWAKWKNRMQHKRSDDIIIYTVTAFFVLSVVGTIAYLIIRH